MRAVELYLIVSAGVTYHLTSAAAAQTHNGDTYEPVTVGRTQIQTKQEISKASIDVSLALDHPLAIALLTRWTEDVTTLTLFRKRTDGTFVIWKGRMTSVKPQDTSIAMTFESIFTSMRRPGLRARFQKSCRHPLYQRGCWLDAEDFAEDATVTDIDGREITAAGADAQPDAYYTGGMIRAPDGTLSYIAEHDGTRLVLNRVSTSLTLAFAAAPDGLDVRLYPGCDHSYATCEAKFDNDDNYGGFDYIPTKNPMGGSSIV